MPTTRDACTTWYEDEEEGEELEDEEEDEEYGEEYEEEYEEKYEEKYEQKQEDEKEEEKDEDSDYDTYNDDDDARFLEWRTNGYMRTPNLFYSWQERVQPNSHSRDSIMQNYIDPKNS